MHRLIRSLSYTLVMTGVIAGSGCVIAPDHGYDRGYSRHDDRDYREHERHEAYRHCREEGGRDCDDLLHR